MGEIPGIISFSSRLFLSLRGAADLRGAHQIGLRAGRARPLYRLTLARPPFPLPFPCPLSLSLTASPLQPPSRPPLPPLHAPRGPQAHRRRPSARAQISARRAPPALPPRPPTLGAPARAAGALRIAYSLFVPRLPRRPVAGGRLLPCPRRVYISSGAGRPCPAKPGAASAWKP